MLRYHDFELVAMYPLPQVSQSQSVYKQAYLKYQSEKHGHRMHQSIPSSSKFGGGGGGIGNKSTISDVSPSRFTMVPRSQRGNKKGNLSINSAIGGGRAQANNNHHSVLLSNRASLGPRRLPPNNSKIPEYQQKEYIRRDFSPYIKRFLLNNQKN